MLNWLKNKFYEFCTSIKANKNNLELLEKHSLNFGNIIIFIYSCLLLIFGHSLLSIFCLSSLIIIIYIAFNSALSSKLKTSKIDETKLIYKIIIACNEVASLLNPIFVPLSTIISNYNYVEQILDLQKQSNMIFLGKSAFIIYVIGTILYYCINNYNKKEVEQMNEFFKKSNREEIINQFKNFYNIVDDAKIEFVIDEYFKHSDGLVYCFYIEIENVDTFIVDNIFTYSSNIGCCNAEEYTVYCSFVKKEIDGYKLYFNVLNEKLNNQLGYIIQKLSNSLLRLSQNNLNIKLVLENNNLLLYSKDKLDFDFIDKLEQNPNYIFIEIIPYKNELNHTNLNYCYLVKKISIKGEEKLTLSFPYTIQE